MYPSGPCCLHHGFSDNAADAAKIISKMAVRLSAMNPVSKSLVFAEARFVTKSVWPRCAASIPIKNRKLSLGQNR